MFLNKVDTPFSLVLSFTSAASKSFSLRKRSSDFLMRNIALTWAMSSDLSIGLVRKASAPESSPLTRRISTDSSQHNNRYVLC